MSHTKIKRPIKYLNQQNEKSPLTLTDWRKKWGHDAGNPYLG
jgi:hypothetical protein